jgi:hypothetical protein
VFFLFYAVFSRNSLRIGSDDRANHRQITKQLTGTIPMIDMFANFPVSIDMNFGHAMKQQIGMRPVFNRPVMSQRR